MGDDQCANPAGGDDGTDPCPAAVTFVTTEHFTPGWAALTETERKVAALLTEGLSNPDIAARMFTSRRTVQYHVSNILAKLGLSSRVELATLVARRAG